MTSLIFNNVLPGNAAVYVQRRYQPGFDGKEKEIDIDKKQIDYAMGSGRCARTCLHRAANGTFVDPPSAGTSKRADIGRRLARKYFVLSRARKQVVAKFRAGT
jgi:hypothetical protein